MEIRRLGEVLKSPGRTISDIREGRVFAYPTDTVYGLGCNALKEGSVMRIRRAKKSRKPFTVIAPSREWISGNLEVRFPEYLDRLPGPYTLVFRKKKPLLREAAPGESLGVRIPDHPFTRLVQEAGVPFVTTSANLSGEVVASSPEGLPSGIRGAADIVIDSGRLGTNPSAVIDLTGASPKTIRAAYHDLKDFVREQESLAKRISLEDGFRRVRTVAGADSAFSGGRVFSAVVLCRFPSMRVLEVATHSERVGFPYIPGFLSYREAPPVSRALARLKARPDILLVDGQGICHPRGIGLASHIGVTLNIPSIGVAKSRLCGDIRGEKIFLKGRQAGWAVRNGGFRTLYVSPGHMASLDSSLRIVRACLKGHRLPEPLRLAHLEAGMRKRD